MQERQRPSDKISSLVTGIFIWNLNYLVSPLPN